MSLIDFPNIHVLPNLCIANFSSPHQFEFSNGCVLEACSSTRTKRLELEVIEELIPRAKWTDVRIDFRMTDVVAKEIDLMQSYDWLDIILVPLPVLQAAKNCNISKAKLRVIRIEDRLNKLVSPHRFCI